MITPILLAASFALQQAEFAKYHREITGREPAPNAVAFAIDPKVSASGKDAYVIKSLEFGVGGCESHQLPTCRITGSNTRSVWYGLYDLLERRGGCHWFWDVDVVPKKASIDLSGLDVKEEAHFEYRAIRYFAHRGLTRFQAEHWGPEDWRREIDWCLKRRLNVFMLRIGQDDLFQRAFPETCAYPDPAKDLSGHGKGYDNRSLFWPLEFRSRLRRNLQRYAFDRGLLVPEDFGTMTHWYSRTPEDFLAKKNPPFLPQATHSYSEKNGLVWDIRDDKWVDEYWKLTTAAVDAYGQGKGQQLLHTIGLGERNCFTNRADNLALKIASLKKFLDRAHRDYPNAKTLLAGWDFYFTWRPNEVRELVAHLDPKRDIIWDYEGDSTRDYRPEMCDLGGNNFTQWGVVGKFPYTYSVFLAFESALDIRANYPLIESRQKIVQNDPACVGYIFWPESSHTDTLLLRHFTANAWSREAQPVGAVLNEFCASRYGAQAERMKAIWQRVIPMSQMLDWGSNYSYLFTYENLGRNQYKDGKDKVLKWGPLVAEAPAVFAALAEVDWTDEAVRRDTIDLARTALDRLIIQRTREFVRDYELWQEGRRTGDDLFGRIGSIASLAEQMADVLALHTDYSLWESYLRLDEIEKVRSPNFAKVLFDNASCGYCQSHQYELARYWYAPRARAFVRRVTELVGANDRKTALKLPKGEAERLALMERPLESLRPTLPRTPENYRMIMRKLRNLETKKPQ